MGYSVCNIHNSFKPTGPAVQVISEESLKNQPDLYHFLRHVETGFVEKISITKHIAGTEIDIPSNVVLDLIEDKLDNGGKLLCCDEYYTTPNLIEECTNRKIPFLGRIKNYKLFEGLPDLVLIGSDQTVKQVQFCNSPQYMVWICREESLESLIEPIILEWVLLQL